MTATNQCNLSKLLHFKFGPLHFSITISGDALADFLMQHLGHALSAPIPKAPNLLLVNETKRVPQSTAMWRLGGEPTEVFSGAGTVPFFCFGDFADEIGKPFDERRHRSVFVALRYAVEHWFPQVQGISVHGSSLVYEGLGVLAVGPSGVGKSTLARIAGAAFCDEWSLVYFRDGAWWFTPPPLPRPFVGQHLTHPHRVHALVLPRHAPPTQLVKIKAMHAIKALLGQAHHLDRPQKAWDLWLHNASLFCEQVPAFELWFTPDLGAINPLHSVLGN